MSDTAIIGEDVEVIGTGTTAGNTPFSWSAAIAGAFAATAVAFIIISLGSGIGLSLASPYSWGPSGTTLTIIGAMWLVMAHIFGFATGGYMAARLRSHSYDGIVDETRFRDAAQGFLVWSIGVVAMAAIAGMAALFTAGAAAHVASGAAAGTGAAMSNPQNTASASDTTGYFVDMLFRPSSATASAGTQSPMSAAPGSATVGAAPAGPAAAGSMSSAQQRLDAESRAEVTRIVARGVAQGGLTDQDRTYLAQLVSQRTGLPPDEAQRRVTEVEGKAKETAKDVADKAAKAGSYFSFWTFMSLLLGAAAATLGGIVGGDLRDKDSMSARDVAYR
ncbi:MAG: hypothetical protein ACJ8EU_05090 [Xanthobacteraceae bacterium]